MYSLTLIRYSPLEMCTATTPAHSAISPSRSRTISPTPTPFVPVMPVDQIEFEKAWFAAFGTDTFIPCMNRLRNVTTLATLGTDTVAPCVGRFRNFTRLAAKRALPSTRIPWVPVASGRTRPAFAAAVLPLMKSEYTEYCVHKALP